MNRSTARARWVAVLLVILTAVGLLAMHGLGGTVPHAVGHAVPTVAHEQAAAPAGGHADDSPAPDGGCADACGEHLLVLCLAVLVTLAAVLLPHLQQRRALLAAPRRGPPPAPPALRYDPQPPDLVADLCTSRR